MGVGYEENGTHYKPGWPAGLWFCCEVCWVTVGQSFSLSGSPFVMLTKTLMITSAFFPGANSSSRFVWEGDLGVSDI